MHNQLSKNIEWINPEDNQESKLNVIKQALYKRLQSSVKSRTQKASGYPDRVIDAEQEFLPLTAEDSGYNPTYYTAPVVIDNNCTINLKGWADPEDIDKVGRVIKSYEGELSFKSDKPLNPRTRTGIEGRGLLGKWGPNFAADPIITRLNPNTGKLEFALIRRKDNNEWAIPGGMVDEGEALSATLSREFKEEAGLDLDMSSGTLIYQGYVDDPRNTDNAWMETTAVHLHLNDADARVAELNAGDDAADVKWVSLSGEVLDSLYASHGSMIALAICNILESQSIELNDEQKNELLFIVSNFAINQ